jgi:hypothetical protein
MPSASRDLRSTQRRAEDSLTPIGSNRSTPEPAYEQREVSPPISKAGAREDRGETLDDDHAPSNSEQRLARDQSVVTEGPTRMVEEENFSDKDGDNLPTRPEMIAIPVDILAKLNSRIEQLEADA